MNLKNLIIKKCKFIKIIKSGHYKDFYTDFQVVNRDKHSHVNY